MLLLPVLDPLGSAALLYSVLIALFDVSYTAFLVPLGIGFESSWTGTGFLTVANWVGSECTLPRFNGIVLAFTWHSACLGWGSSLTAHTGPGHHRPARLLLAGAAAWPHDQPPGHRPIPPPPAGAIYLFDLLMGFQIGLLVVWDARWLKITDGRVVAWYYVREGVFAVNLVACVPMFAQVRSSGPGLQHAPGRVVLGLP